MVYECTNERILYYPTIWIFLVTSAIVFIYEQKNCALNCLNHLNSFIVTELIIIEKSGWGNFLSRKTFFLLVNLLKNSLYTYR